MNRDENVSRDMSAFERKWTAEHPEMVKAMQPITPEMKAQFATPPNFAPAPVPSDNRWDELIAENALYAKQLTNDPWAAGLLDLFEKALRFERDRADAAEAWGRAEMKRGDNELDQIGEMHAGIVALQNRVQEAKAEALEEAADFVDAEMFYTLTRRELADWLRTRAATYRQGDGQ